MKIEWSDAQKELFAAFNKMQDSHASGDADTFKTLVAEHSYHFGSDQSLLVEQFSGVDVERIKAGRKAGMSMSFRVRHPDVFVYGANREFGVVTCYVAGMIKSPGGTVETGVWRSSSIWVRESGNWLNVHSHTSPMQIGHVTTEPSTEQKKDWIYY